MFPTALPSLTTTLAPASADSPVSSVSTISSVSCFSWLVCASSLLFSCEVFLIHRLPAKIPSLLLRIKLLFLFHACTSNFFSLKPKPCYPLLHVNFRNSGTESLTLQPFAGSCHLLQKFSTFS